MGVGGISFQWITSYLNGSRQYVSFQNEFFLYANVVCGVLQGSIHVPLLFILYIYDICNISNTFRFILIADDTC